MRSRYWVYEAPDEVGLELMVFCMEEMGHLADMLPELYMNETGGQ